MLSNIKNILEWDRFKTFLNLSRWRVFLYVFLSIVSDMLMVVIPVLVILTVTLQTGGETTALTERFSNIFVPEITFPLGFALLILQQSLIYIRLKTVKQLDRQYFHTEGKKVLDQYKSLPFYKSDFSENMRRVWFSKNIARNVRHTSEAMQAQLKMVPEFISLILALTALLLTNWVPAALVVPAIILTAFLLISQSLKIFALSEKHFTNILPKFAKKITTVLGKVYRTTADIPIPEQMDPEFSEFLDSRYRLDLKRGFFVAYTAVIIGALLLFVIFVCVKMGITRQAPSEILLVQVALLMQIMNKGRGLLSGVGSISSLYPQIKMSRDISNGLNASQKLIEDRERRQDPELFRKLPFILHINGNGQITKFNLLFILEYIEQLFGEDSETIPIEDVAFVPFRAVEEQMEHLGDGLDPKKLLARQIIDAWAHAGKRIMILDWKVINTMKVSDLWKLRIYKKNHKLVIVTQATFPKSWLTKFGDDYVKVDWDDPTLFKNTNSMGDLDADQDFD